MQQTTDQTVTNHDLSELGKELSSIAKALAQVSKTLKKATRSSKKNNSEVVTLSPAARKRYNKAIADIKKGRNILKPKDSKEFFEILHS